ncbi:MAG TPA: sulfotransferase [Gammaproteobacteria bacterium]|nr:sulfotransferase [Gammaproteobacteria bacterium]
MTAPATGNLSRDQALSSYHKGLELYQAGDEAAARNAFAEAVSLDDSLAPAHYQLGNCLRRTGDTRGAEQELKHAIARDVSLTDAHVSLFYLYRGLGRLKEARTTLMALIAANSADTRICYQMAEMLQEIGCHADAASVYEACLKREPQNARAWLRSGRIYQRMGRFRDAERAFLAAIEQDAETDAAYMLLAHTRRFGSSDRALIERFETTLRAPGLSEETAKCLHFGLGKMHDDLGEYGPAFEHFRTANSLHRRHVYFDRAALKNFVETSKQVFTPELFKHRHINALELPVPCFVVGMPRSGTTLVERILASHPDVHGLGETELVDMLAEQVSEMVGAPYPHRIGDLNAASREALSAQFCSQRPIEAQTALRVIDKNPLNFLHLGLIALIFPDAPVLYCTRDPLDTCLSIYFQHFAHPRNSYAYDLDDIAFFHRQYRELMSHWCKVLPVPPREIIYEELVNNPEAEIRTLVSVTGLDWNPVCLEFHKHGGSISTASLWQARQAIYRDSVGRWHHYAEHLQDLMHAFER